MPESKQVYTIGYVTTNPVELAEIAMRLGAIIVDVRLNANSRVPEWRKSALEKRFGPYRYRYLPDMGNVNYKNDLPIQLRDPSAAVPVIKELLSHGPIILMCACGKHADCHRTQVAAYLEGELGTTTQHLYGKARKAKASEKQEQEGAPAPAASEAPAEDTPGQLTIPF